MVKASAYRESRLGELWRIYNPRTRWMRWRKACVCCGRKDIRTETSWWCGICKYFGSTECYRGMDCKR